MSGAAPAPSSASDPAPFEATSPQVYVAKIKNVLVGLGPTGDEVAAVLAQPSALGDLVDTWMARPEYAQKMLRFFELAFQQTQVTSNDFADQVHAQLGMNPVTTPRLLQNAQESFARTVLMLNAQGRPFTDAMTTKQVMMTTALKELYAFLDSVDIDNESNTYDRFRAKYREVQMTAEASLGPIPISQTLDPASPRYMHWYNPDVAIAGKTMPGCAQDPVLLPTRAITLHWLLLGTIDGRTLADGTTCPLYEGSASASQFLESDFSDWDLVTMRPPHPGEETTRFWELPALRTTHEMVIAMPRAGFFSTPAFFANWPTNVSNQIRVLANQSLIVATGASIDGTDTTVPPSMPGLDALHAGSDACVTCHQTLDPTRSILASTWTWNYHAQLDPVWTAERGLFAFRGMIRPVASIDDFANALSQHPLLAQAWAQKLCWYVNSSECDAADPELQRVAARFVDAGYAWDALVKELVTSPLTTHAARTSSADKSGETIAVARRDHLCAALNARLRLEDVCGLNPEGGALSAIATGLPSDGYGRGSIAPILPNDPTLFFRAAVENICQTVSARVIDPEAPSQKQRRWSSADPKTAIADFVDVVMGLPPADARSENARTLLQSHFDASMAQPGIAAVDALRSTFTVACMAPSAISVGL